MLHFIIRDYKGTQGKYFFACCRTAASVGLILIFKYWKNIDLIVSLLTKRRQSLIYSCFQTLVEIGCQKNQTLLPYSKLNYYELAFRAALRWSLKYR
jgi:hypothetical protein